MVVKINRKPVRALIDTGSQMSIIDEQFVKQLRLKSRSLCTGEISRLFSANGSQMPVVAIADLNIYISGLIIPLFVKVVRAMNHDLIHHDLILGADSLVENQVVIDYSTGVVSIQQDLLRVSLNLGLRGSIVLSLLKRRVFLY